MNAIELSKAKENTFGRNFFLDAGTESVCPDSLGTVRAQWNGCFDTPGFLIQSSVIVQQTEAFLKLPFVH